MQRMISYIYQKKDWPHFSWDDKTLLPLLGEVRNLQGRLIGKMETLGFELRNEAVLETITLDVIKTTEIEGVILAAEQVRSSVARQLGMNISGMVHSDRDVDGVVDMMMDATRNFEKEISAERLFSWHSALFPHGRSGMHRIIPGNWRNDSTGPMQVVSGAMGKEKVHFQAPKAALLEKEMGTFILWFNQDATTDPVIKSALAHLWFVTLHPFEDGNGRIGRALTDMLLARSDGISQRFYSMSAQIRLERRGYYEILEKSQKGDMDVTAWLEWFLLCLRNALIATEQTIAKVMFKHQFWNKYAREVLNQRQVMLLNRLLDGFTGNLSTSKWAKIAKCSPDTALRDIQYLIDKNILRKDAAGGRSTHYILFDIPPIINNN